MERWLDEEDGRTREFVPFENEYGWINASFERLVQDELCARKEPYLWGVLQGAALAKVMGLKRNLGHRVRRCGRLRVAGA
jgi:hypothetical protein